MTVRIAINGFGRIGRVVARLLLSQSYPSDLELVAINDLTSATTLAHLFRYDSVHGRYVGRVETDEKSLIVDGEPIPVFAERDPRKLPWRSLSVDVVLECTGIFRKHKDASQHLEAGARKVLISAPSPDPDCTLAMGVNHQDYKKDSHNIVSCASCTTNCLAPVAKVLHENFSIQRGTMTTIHSYTNDQQLLDLPHSDLRRARAAALSMIPTTTGAAKALGLVVPDLKGKVDGFSVRVPTPDVSLVDFVCEVSKETTVEEVNAAFRKASTSSLKHILGYSEEPLVSADYLGTTHSATIDALSTMVIDRKLIKSVAWYDNEVGFSARMLDVSRLLGSQ